MFSTATASTTPFQRCVAAVPAVTRAFAAGVPPLITLGFGHTHTPLASFSFPLPYFVQVDSSNSRSPMFVSMGADTYSGGTGMDGLNGIGSGGTTGTTGTTTSGRKVFVPPVITRPAANGKGSLSWCIL